MLKGFLNFFRSHPTLSLLLGQIKVKWFILNDRSSNAVMCTSKVVFLFQIPSTPWRCDERNEIKFSPHEAFLSSQAFRFRTFILIASLSSAGLLLTFWRRCLSRAFGRWTCFLSPDVKRRNLRDKNIVDHKVGSDGWGIYRCSRFHITFRIEIYWKQPMVWNKSACWKISQKVKQCIAS